MIRGEYGEDVTIYKYDDDSKIETLNLVPPRVVLIEILTIKGNWCHEKTEGRYGKYYVFNLILNGSKQVGIGKEKYIGRTGDILLFKPHTFMQGKTASPKEDFVALSVVIDFADESFHHEKIKEKWNSLCLLPKDKNEPIRRLLEKIRDEFSNNKKVNYFLVKNYLFELFTSIVNWKDENKLISLKLSRNIELSIKAKKYIEENFTKEISVNDIAEKLYLSPSRFAHIFKDVAGFSPISYLLKIKMNYAKKLLKTTTSTITEVSEKSGFKNIHYFSTIFKKMEKLTPGQYKSKYSRKSK
ncbi:MAG: hypothetical protein A2252_06115 [Elusimicrobia bacterium RIFOXYA2_FULL_39_19]|nr:MAG: hypothetical protein A2252_06115 [Elusimicrobia bacterium RIFOXYA2_FULL_39_19]